MNKTDEARKHLSSVFGSEYSKYINSRLAGDFAVVLSEKLKAKQCLLYVDPELSCQALRDRKTELERVE